MYPDLAMLSLGGRLKEAIGPAIIIIGLATSLWICLLVWRAEGPFLMRVISGLLLLVVGSAVSMAFGFIAIMKFNHVMLGGHGRPFRRRGQARKAKIGFGTQWMA